MNELSILINAIADQVDLERQQPADDMLVKMARLKSILECRQAKARA